jgi:hypothetical protein
MLGMLHGILTDKLYIKNKHKYYNAFLLVTIINILTGSNPMYALYQSGYNIFGVGETPAEARKDAEEWIDFTPINKDGDSLTISKPDMLSMVPILERDEGEITGHLYIRPCTKRLVRVVMTGAFVPYDVTEAGTLDIINE